MTTVSINSYTTDDYQEIPAIPSFEGQDVAHTNLKIAGVNKLDIDDVVFHSGDVHEITLRVRVTDIAHNIDKKSGDIVRAQTVQVLSAQVNN